MSKLSVIVGLLAITTSGYLSATKCDDAKKFLEDHKANLIATFNVETTNESVKLTQQSANARIASLERAIERKHGFMCEHEVKHLKKDRKYVEDNL